jgi:hypothetical protein
MSDTNLIDSRALVELERQGWIALSTSGDAAAHHYNGVLADEILFLLPGGLLIDDRQEAIRALRGEPWTTFDITDAQVLLFSESTAALTYRAVARRDGDEYEALCNSTYVLSDSRWRLALHQQTPV